MNRWKNISYFGLLLFAMISLCPEGKVKTLTFGHHPTQVKKSETEKFSKIKKTMTDLDFKIEIKNSEYLEQLKKIQSLESSIAECLRELKENRLKLKETYLQTQKNLQQHYLQKINNNYQSLDLWQEKILQKKLSDELQRIKFLIEENRKKDEELLKFNKMLVDFKQTEVEMLSVLFNMEQQKKLFSAELQRESPQQKNVPKKTLAKDIHNLQQLIVESLGDSLEIPIKNLKDYRYDEKGITFRASKETPIVASGAGTVVYSDRLSEYGRVLIIDHGEEWRSIYLGEFAPQVKKDKLVKKGDLLAFLGSKGQFYFEVRKKGLVQNTYMIFAQQLGRF